MTPFDRWWAFAVVAEGQYSNDPDDPGKETKWGITRPPFEEAKRRGLIPQNRELRDLTQDEARIVALHLYWRPFMCDELPMPFAIVLMDGVFNQPGHEVVRLLQQAVRVRPDGLMGPDTIAAANRAASRLDTLDRFLALRIRRYHEKSKEKFKDGLVMRALRLARFVWAQA